MGYAEKIYEQIRHLPEPIAKEVLDFAEFVASRQAVTAAPTGSQEERQQRRSNVEQVFAKYQIDLSTFRFDREEANARH
ncbi:MAG: DUF2281 domain-containing protein [Pseudomonadales bacterium]|nr:DUF2281 domain-containing protein [Pseudomonadales bacterium]